MKIQSVIYIAGILVVVNLVRKIRSAETSASNISEKIYPAKVYSCPYRPGAQITNENTRKVCCDHIVNRFESQWFVGGAYLTSYLSVLKSWECVQFKEECSSNTFAYTEFTKLVYMRECNSTIFHQTCNPKIHDILKFKIGMPIPKQQNQPMQIDTTLSSKYKSMVSKLRTTDYDLKELLEPCIQVAAYDSERSGFGRYHEVVQPFIPFCGFVWCGVDVDTLDVNRGISAWTCMPKSCQVNLIIVMAILGIFGLITLIGNATIITVFARNNKMRNSQAFYKITLAVGDILVGGIVFPTFIYTFYALVVKPQSMGEYLNITSRANLPEFAPGGETAERFSQHYIRTVGFFTTFSLFVSVYSLMAASFDRLYAIMRPLAYNKLKSQYWTVVQCICILTIGLVFAALPLFSSNLEYQLVSFVLVASYGENALIMYCITFLIPLVMLWFTTIAILCYSHKRAQIRKSMSNSKDNFEKRLAKTLAIMVGVFSSAILPAIIIMIVSLNIKNVYTKRPKELNQNSAAIYNSIELACMVILTSNSLWNVFIYSSMHQDFRRAATLLFRKSFYVLTFRSNTELSSFSKSSKRSRRRKLSTIKPAITESKNTTLDGVSEHQNNSSVPYQNDRGKRIGRRDFGGTMESIIEAVESNDDVIT